MQGLDYAYTINGWTKGINSETLNETRDIGRDGDNNTPNLNKFFARDVFGYALRYFDYDYKAVGSQQSTVGKYFLANNLNVIPLYNGNISSTTTVMNGLNKIGFNYRYDQLNRLMTSTAFNGLDTVSNTWNHNPLNDYQMQLRYDPNGNILNNFRNATTANGNPLLMDVLTYNYYSGTNRLQYVEDSVPDNNYTDDINHQPINNYDYTAIGELMKDESEEIDTILWNVYGKAIEIKRKPGSQKPALEFSYSGDGNRISKKVMFPSGSGVDETTYYTRDASGNIMATYTLRSDTFSIDEHVIYGSSRLGVVKRDKLLAVKSTGGRPTGLFPGGNISVPGVRGPLSVGHININNIQFLPSQPGSSFTHTLGFKRYELDNWLGNVNVVVSDRKLQVDTNSDGVVDYYGADVRSAVDMYPGGMMMPNRNYNPAEYRFGHNTQEKVDEISGTGKHYTALFWEYDPRTVRRWNLDPVLKQWESPYATFSNNPIWFSDVLGDTDDKKTITNPKNESTIHEESKKLVQHNDDLISISPIKDPVISSEVGTRDAPIAGASTNHPGIDIVQLDIGVVEGMDVVAPVNAKVVSIKFASDDNKAGNRIHLKADASGKINSFFHLQGTNFAEGLSAGDQVVRGQKIGQVGTTGNSEAPHLHFEIRGNPGAGTIYNPRNENAGLRNAPTTTYARSQNQLQIQKADKIQRTPNHSIIGY